MPCMDGGPIPEERARKTRSENKFLTAALCAVLTASEQLTLLETLLLSVDWEEAGIEEEALEKWWEKHKELDRARRLAEAEKRELKRIDREREKRAEEALKKLSEEERDALRYSGILRR